MLAFALFLAAGVAFAAPAPVVKDTDWTAIRKVIGDQLAALKAGDSVKAMTFAAPGIQAQFGTADNVMRMVRDGYSALLAARRHAFLQGAVIEDAVVQPLRLILPDETVVVALYQMQKQPDGRWRIAGCVIAPSTVQST
jgi:ketosteroid isomerase-like protein